MTSSSFGRIYLGSTLVSEVRQWIRPAAWPAIPTVLATEQKIVGLYAVWPGDSVGNGGNFFAFNAQGAYTINYGDGTTTNYASNTQANYEFNYNNLTLVGTECPVTFTASGNLVNRTAHGLTAGRIVNFYNIQTTTGISQAADYYVINPTANSFQVALTNGGPPVALTNNGSAQLLPYRVAIVTITPQAGQNLTVVNFQAKHTQAGLQAYATGWLDLAISVPNVSGSNFTLGGATVLHRLAERVNIIACGVLTSMNSMFRNFALLQSIPSIPSVSSVTDMSLMFSNCYALRTIPQLTGSVAAVTSMASMFAQASSLETIPPFPGSVAAVTTMSNMFAACSALKAIPPFPGSVAAVTTMASMFSFSYALKTIPPFPGSVAALTNTSNMFSSCLGLNSVPPFPSSTAGVTNMNSMFNACNALQSVPVMNLAGVSSATEATTIFGTCSSLARAQISGMRFSFSVANCKLSAVALNEIFTGLPTVTGQTITVTGNYGINQAGYDPTIATAKGWTVTA